MASPLPMTESRADIDGEITESAPAPLAKAILYIGDFGKKVDTALKMFGLVPLKIRYSYVLYAQKEDDASYAYFMKLLSHEGGSPARPDHVEPFEATVIQSFAALSDFLEQKKARSVHGVHDEFIVLIQCPASIDPVIIDVQNEYDEPILKKFAGWMKKMLSGKNKSVHKVDDIRLKLVLLLCFGVLTCPNARPTGPSWVIHFVECAKIVGLACTVAAFEMRNHELPLSTAMIKVGAIANSSGLIMVVATPLPLAVGLPMGLLGLLIMVAAALFI